jgi:hypothetical protein
LIAFKPETIRGLRVTAVPGAQEARDTPSDTGSDVSVLQPEFGEIVNFEEVGQDWQKKEGGNSIDMKSLHERARKLRLWLRKRPETEIVLVMHGLFAHYMTGNIDENGNQTGNVWSAGVGTLLINVVTGPYWTNLIWRTFSIADADDENAFLVETEESKDRPQQDFWIVN